MNKMFLRKVCLEICVSSFRMITFLRNSIFHHTLHKVQQFIYPLFAEENWNIKQILWRAFMNGFDQSNTWKKFKLYWTHCLQK